jgi:hypothetical protein
MIRFNPQHTAETGNCAAQVTEFLVDPCQVKVGFEKIGAGIYGILKTADGIIQTAAGHENSAQIVESLGMTAIRIQDQPVKLRRLIQLSFLMTGEGFIKYIV